MSWMLIITLILLGLLLVLLEGLVIPGTTFVGLLGFGGIIAGIVLGFENGQTAGWITLIATVVVLAVVVYFVLKSKTWKAFMLNTEVDGRVNTIDESKLSVGDRGVAISRLAPMGKASFNDEFYEVQSDSGLIDENTAISIKKIDGNKIIVSADSASL